MTKHLTLENITLIVQLVKDETDFTWEQDTKGITMQDFIQAAKDMLRYQGTIKNIRQAIEEQCSDLVLVEEIWQDVADATDTPLPSQLHPFSFPGAV